MTGIDLSRAEWRKSRYSGQSGNCVEVRLGCRGWWRSVTPRNRAGRGWWCRGKPGGSSSERYAPSRPVRAGCPPLRSRDKDFLAMPIEILAPGELSAVWKKQGLQQRRPSVVLPGETISADSVSQWLGDVDLQLRADGEQSRIESHIVAGTAGQAVPWIQALGGRAVLPRFDVTGKQHLLGTERGRVQAAEDAAATAVVQHVQGEHMLADAGRSEDDPFGVPLGQVAPGDAAGI